MKNASELIARLQSEYNCRLSEEQIISHLNAFEKRLCIEVLKNTEFLSVELNGEKNLALDFYAKDIVSVSLNGKMLKKSSLLNAGFRAEGKTLYIDTKPFGSLRVEHISFPEQYTILNISDRQLVLAEGYDDLYIYHILSREALLENDIDRLNNYCLLYSESLNALKADMKEKNDKILGTNNSVDRFNKVW